MEDFPGKNYRGIEKKKRLAMKDMINDWYIYEQSHIDYVPPKDPKKDNTNHYRYYPTTSKQEKKEQQPQPQHKRYFIKRKPQPINNSNFTIPENFSIINTLKGTPKSSKIFWKIVSFLDKDSKNALSLTCKYFYKEYYSDKGVIVSGYMEELSELLSLRGLYIFSKIYRSNHLSQHLWRYIYNGGNFKGLELLENIRESVEITSPENLKTLKKFNTISENIYRSRFNASVIQMPDRFEVFVWQAMFVPMSIKSFPYLNAKYTFTDVFDSVKFISDELLLVTTKKDTSFTSFLYRVSIRDLEDINTDFNIAAEKFENMTKPLAIVHSYSEALNLSEDQEYKTQPLFIKKEFNVENVRVLTKGKYIYLFYLSNFSVDVIDYEKGQLLHSLNYDKIEFETFEISPLGNFLGRTKDNFFYYIQIEHKDDISETIAYFKKLEVGLFKADCQGMHYTFTQFYDSSNILEEYLVYTSDYPNPSAIQFFNFRTQELSLIEVEPLIQAWNTHRGRMMVLTDDAQLKLYDIQTKKILFVSEKLSGSIKKGFGKNNIAFDDFHVLILIQGTSSAELTCFPFLLSKSRLLINKAIPFRWNLEIGKLGFENEFKSRYLSLNFDNNTIFIRGDNGSVLIDFISDLELNSHNTYFRASVNLRETANKKVGVKKKRINKKPKNNRVEGHIADMNFIPDINNVLDPASIVERDYLVTVRDWSLPEDQQKDWPEILEEAKNLPFGQKMKLVSSLYKKTLRGHNMYQLPARKEIDYIHKISAQHKKKANNNRTKQRDEKHSEV